MLILTYGSRWNNKLPHAGSGKPEVNKLPPSSRPQVTGYWALDAGERHVEPAPHRGNFHSLRDGVPAIGRGVLRMTWYVRDCGPLAMVYRRYGCQRLPVLLPREGFMINHKKTYRLYREEQLPVRRRRRRRYSAANRLPLPSRVHRIGVGQWIFCVTGS